MPKIPQYVQHNGQYSRFALKSSQTNAGEFMISNNPHQDCTQLGVQVAEHGRRLGDHQLQIDALKRSNDQILKIVTEAKESQDRACAVMEKTGTALTAKLETMANTQHAMQLEAKELSTTFKLDRENQSTKKTDNRWLMGVVLSLITAANILIPWFRN